MQHTSAKVCLHTLTISRAVLVYGLSKPLGDKQTCPPSKSKSYWQSRALFTALGRVGQPTVVLDTVGVDKTDIWEEDFSVLVFVFGDVLLSSRNSQRGTLPVSFLVFWMFQRRCHVWLPPCGCSPDPWGLWSLCSNLAQTSCWRDGEMAMTAVRQQQEAHGETLQVFESR